MIDKEATLLEIGNNVRSSGINANDDEVNKVLKDFLVGRKKMVSFEFLSSNRWTRTSSVRNSEWLKASILVCLLDGEIHPIREVYDWVCDDLHVTNKEKNISIASGIGSKINNQIRQVRRGLVEEGLIKHYKVSGLKIGDWQLTDTGCSEAKQLKNMDKEIMEKITKEI